MAKARDRDHPLADQIKEAADKAADEQKKDKAEAKDATKEGRTGSDRDYDKKSQKVAEEQPSDDKTSVGEQLKGEQSVTRPGDLQSQRDLLDEPDAADDLLDDPTQTRLQRVLKPGEQIDDPSIAVARLPERQAEHAEKYLAELGKGSGGAPFTERDPKDVHVREADLSPEDVHPFAGRNVPEEPGFLLRDADAKGDTEIVQLDRRWEMDADAPKGGEEGGAKLAEPDERKKNPGAPWPGPGESMAASPTAAPEPGPEPTVQLEPPQADIKWEHKPEAAVGTIGPGAADQELRRLATRSEVDIFQEQRSGKAQTTAEMVREQRLAAREHGEQIKAAQERDRGPKSHGDGHPRDEAGQISLDYMTEKALEAIGAIFKSAEDVPEPFRVRIALEHAARRVMSPQWWDIAAKHFDKGDSKPEKAA